MKIRDSGLPGFNKSLSCFLQKIQNSLDVVTLFRSANYGALIFSQQWSCLVQYIGKIRNLFFGLDQLKGVPCFFFFEMIDLVITIDEEKLRNVLFLF